MLFSESGKLLLSGGTDETIRVWNARSLQLVDVLHSSPGHAVTCVVISPTENLIADGAVVMRCLHLCVAYSMSGSMDGTVQLWHITDGTLIKRTLDKSNEEDLLAKERETMSRREGQIGLSEAKNRLRSNKFAFFEQFADPVATAQPVEPIAIGTLKPSLTLRGHSASIVAVCFAPGGKVVCSASLDATCVLWSLNGTSA